MSEFEIRRRILALRNELESRYKTGMAKIADSNGKPISTEKLQNEMYSLIYKLSKILNNEKTG